MLGNLAGPVAASLAFHAALLGAVVPGSGDGSIQEPGQPSLRVSLDLSAPSRDARRPAQADSGGPPVQGPRRYLKPSELDQGPIPIELAPLVYPEKEYVNRIPGVVRMQIYISESGAVERCEVVSATPAGRFEQAAIEAVQATRFKPGLKDGRPVPSQKLIEVGFDPYGPRPGEER
jgi:TonB family protein